ncbi:hypothetical protein [Roseateles oligotrophus]|uniref:DUF4124 domain-containing protein n=1 Tax=Roseateles oligotrophus TaxID=1769250 RepID=A0ABT2YMR4_9BURK|nr:hypothetical protein [Roseateles oligotrophus]MCV2371170.1 hypothetical protein [Roseateles oligotrophus]
MFRASLLLSAALIAGSASAGEVWKCQVGDQIKYSDRPCQAAGEALPSRSLQANVVDAAVKKPAAEAASGAMQNPNTGHRPEANVCPGELEISAMETRASSISLSPEAKAFMQDEVRRARQCSKGQGRYAAADWDISRQAQAAQSSHSGAQDARRRAEDMHSAADASEGDRISSVREQERAQREAQRRQDQRLQNQAARPAASGPAR